MSVVEPTIEEVRAFVLAKREECENGWFAPDASEETRRMEMAHVGAFNDVLNVMEPQKKRMRDVVLDALRDGFGKQAAGDGTRTRLHS
jgi:hypothetical protein